MLFTSSSDLKLVETANGTKFTLSRNLVQWTHSRLVFNKALKRVAVGQDSTLQVEILGTNEALVLAKQVGRTNLMT